MSTHATIGYLENERANYVYCHSDGFPSYLGRMLLEHYNSEELAKALVHLGALSMVRERVAPNPGEQHSFAHPVYSYDTAVMIAQDLGLDPDSVPKDRLGVTTAYARDRGEDFSSGTSRVDSKAAYKRLPHHMFEHSGSSYAYLYDCSKQQWLFADKYTTRDEPFVPLTNEIIEASL